MTPLDLATNTVVGLPIPVGGNPRSIAITPDGTTAYVANSLSNDVSVWENSGENVAEVVVVLHFYQGRLI